MDIHKIIVLRREDLNHFDRKTPIENISLFTSFSNYHELTYTIISGADFVVFIDDATNYMIFKNKYRDTSPETKGLLKYLHLKDD